jgi:pyrroloquinoline quinone biosynthesis protein D
MSIDEIAAPPVDASDEMSARPRVGRGFRLQWEEVQQCFVVLYPEGMVQLNRSAGEIMKRCDGERDLSAIVADLEAAYGVAGLAPEVRSFVALAAKQKWLVLA